MLTRLHVRNYALLDEVGIEFQPGLNILTGETGSGKSILIGALNLILGGRAATEVIRTGAVSAAVEGFFEWQPDTCGPQLPDDMDIDREERELVIRREITRDGRNRCSVNGQMVTVSVLKRIGEALVDLHGQHDHQSLLDPRTHLAFLDGMGDTDGVRNRTAMAWKRLSGLEDQLRRLDEEIRVTQERRELHRYQLAELETADIRPGEDETLERELAILQHAGQLIDTASGVYEALSQQEDAVIDRIALLIRSLEEMERIDDTLQETVNGARSARYQLEDVAANIRQYRDRIDFDPRRLSEVQERLELLKQFKRKYGGTLEEVCTYRDRIAGEIARLETADDRRAQIEIEREQARKTLTDMALKLSKTRRRLAAKLETRVMEELAELGMPKTRFHVRVDWQQTSTGPVEIDGVRYASDASGMDRMEFMIAPNPGEDLKPLAHIASGGEISRVMLALKVILAESDRISTLVFDEIDIGIGGGIAESVGHKLKVLARSHQVLCITHLHQVACWGDAHFTVSKRSTDGRAVTQIGLLENDGRVREIARMLAGETIDDLALTHAREMLRRTAHTPVRAKHA
ncbi:MAG: DNA repair protein RecN [candidate division Zixibacteria bacterium]|nr:DNA repair protein RecN [candidate division Zixibacteria bacterium]